MGGYDSIRYDLTCSGWSIVVGWVYDTILFIFDGLRIYFSKIVADGSFLFVYD